MKEMTVRELANYLAFHPSTIYRWAQRGIIPGEKVKGAWQFSREAIDAWIEQQPGYSPSGSRGGR